MTISLTACNKEDTETLEFEIADLIEVTINGEKIIHKEIFSFKVM